MRLGKDYGQERKCKTGWWRVYPMIFFELLVMQWLFNLSVGVAFRLWLMKLSFR